MQSTSLSSLSSRTVKSLGHTLNSRRASQYPLGFGGAAERSAMDRALRLHNATSGRACICSQCCGEAKIIIEYRPGVGRFSVRVCLKCQWRDDVSYLLEEPEIPYGPGAYTLDSLRCYLQERMGAIEQPLTVVAALQPLARVLPHSLYRRHHINFFALVQEGFLVQVGTEGVNGAPTYRLTAKSPTQLAVVEGDK